MRLEKEEPVLDAFWSWAENSMKKVLPKSKTGKALQYALNHKEKLQTYLEDGNCLISNNIAENSIKPFTVGIKIGSSVVVLKEPMQVPVFIH